jgi:hypothetical protein
MAGRGVAGGSTPVWGGAFTLRIVASVLRSPGIGKEGGAERGASGRMSCSVSSCISKSTR